MMSDKAMGIYPQWVLNAYSNAKNTISSLSGQDYIDADSAMDSIFWGYNGSVPIVHGKPVAFKEDLLNKWVNDVTGWNANSKSKSFGVLTLKQALTDAKVASLKGGGQAPSGNMIGDIMNGIAASTNSNGGKMFDYLADKKTKAKGGGFAGAIKDKADVDTKEAESVKAGAEASGKDTKTAMPKWVIPAVAVVAIVVIGGGIWYYKSQQTPA